MRFLCLHGKGTSAAILESQTASFRRCLRTDCHEPPITFDFIDAPLPSESAPPVDHFYQGPFYSFYASPSSSELEVAHAWLLDLLEQRGPYDGVLAFSQGCALTATLLLRLQRGQLQRRMAGLSPSKNLFKVGIFICGSLPLSFLADQGYEVTDAAREHDKRSAKALQSQASYAALVENGGKRWTGCTNPVCTDITSNTLKTGISVGERLAHAEKVFGLDCTQILPEHIIQIPTVHIYGSRDPRMGSSLQLATLFDADKRLVFDHGGGHDIPRTSSVSNSIADLIRCAITQADEDESTYEGYNYN